MRTAAFCIALFVFFCMYHFTWMPQKKEAGHAHKFHYTQLQVESVKLSSSHFKYKKEGVSNMKFDDGKLEVEMVTKASDISCDSVVIAYDFGKIYVDLKHSKKLQQPKKKQDGFYTLKFTATGLPKSPSALLVDGKVIPERTKETHLYAGKKSASWTVHSDH